MPTIIYNSKTVKKFYGTNSRSFVEVFHIDKKGRHHRFGGPSYIRYDPFTRVVELAEWNRHGVNHRVGGPAVICASLKEWWYKGKRHRVDGPATEWDNGKRSWFIMGVEYSTEGEWFSNLNKEEQVNYLFKIKE